jgi:periplasmic copper chaperone A
MNHPLKTLALSALLALACTVQAQTPAVKVEAAWARTTVPGQLGTGAFMTLTANQPLRLVGASSPAAGVTEVHEMKMEGDVMRMRAISGLDLPVGTAVQLKPGGYHVMLMDLKAALAVGTRVPLTLLLEDAKGQRSSQLVQLPVSARAP